MNIELSSKEVSEIVIQYVKQKIPMPDGYVYEIERWSYVASAEVKIYKPEPESSEGAV